MEATSQKIAFFTLIWALSATVSFAKAPVSGVSVDPECTNGLPNYDAYPYDCRKFYGCEAGNRRLYQCPTDLYWNDIVKACDVLSNVDCSNIQPYPEPDCSSGEQTYWWYPYDCTQFYECLNYKLYQLTCPANSVWDDSIKKCREGATCEEIPYPSTTTTTTTTSPPPTEPTTAAPGPDINCTYEGQYFPDPYDCHKYYECSNGIPYSMDCPNQQVWDQALETCDGDPAGCKTTIVHKAPTRPSFQWKH